MYGSFANQKYLKKVPGHVVYLWSGNDAIPVDSAFIQGCSTANVLLNVMVAHQVFILLQHCRKRQKHKPPSIYRVLVETSIAYGLGVVVLILHLFLLSYQDDATKGYDDATENIVRKIPGSIFLISVLVPGTYLVYICFMVWYQNLIPSLNARTKSLALYFSR